MSTWNHRVLKRKYPTEDYYGIYEVYYNEKGIPEMCTKDPQDVSGENIADLQQLLEWMLKSLNEPVLDYEDFEEGGKYYTELDEWETGTVEEFLNGDEEETNGVA